MKKIIIVLLLLTFKICFAQTGWFYQNPLPQAEDIMSTAYVNENIIYAAAQEGVFLKSTNGGASWNFKSIITLKDRQRYRPHSIFAADENIIYILYRLYNYTSSFPYFIMKSSNAGASWDSLYVTVSVANLDKIKFINQNTGYCYSTSYSEPGVFKTTNAGINWNKFVIPNTTASLHSILWVNENLSWVSSEGFNGFYKTTNGGSNWLTYNLDKRFSFPFFINANTGWLVLDSIYKTTNGGLNYTGIGKVPGLIYDYGFFDNNNGWGIFYGELYITSNSGAIWIKTTNGALTGELISAKFLNALTGISAGQFGKISKTTNGGLNWSNYFNSIIFGEGINNLCMINENTGWALSNFRVIKTTTSGNSWIKVDTTAMYSSLKFINANTGLAAADNYFKKTTDAGATWTTYNYTAYSFRKVSMPTFSTWYIAAFNSNQPVILKTTNAGANWNQFSGASSNFYDLFFIDANTGYYAAPLGVFKTTDGAVSWSQQSSLNAASVFFTDASTGHKIDNGDIYKTTNSGVNWQLQLHIPFLPVQSIHFINSNYGWAACGQLGDYGRIFKTTNGGATWLNNNNFAVKELRSIYFINENTGWASGYGGTMLKTITGGVGIQHISTTIPDKFYLSQNYPNPFNPNTNIEFSLPQKSFVSLKVFDLLGREVANLVNENLSSGSYIYDFNATLLPSGIYFYKLETNNFSETRKMVLVK